MQSTLPPSVYSDNLKKVLLFNLKIKAALHWRNTTVRSDDDHSSHWFGLAELNETILNYGRQDLFYCDPSKFIVWLIATNRVPSPSHAYTILGKELNELADAATHTGAVDFASGWVDIKKVQLLLEYAARVDLHWYRHRRTETHLPHFLVDLLSKVTSAGSRDTRSRVLIAIVKYALVEYQTFHPMSSTTTILESWLITDTNIFQSSVMHVHSGMTRLIPIKRAMWFQRLLWEAIDDRGEIKNPSISIMQLDQPLDARTVRFLFRTFNHISLLKHDILDLNDPNGFWYSVRGENDIYGVPSNHHSENCLLSRLSLEDLCVKSSMFNRTIIHFQLCHGVCSLDSELFSLSSSPVSDSELKEISELMDKVEVKGELAPGTAAPLLSDYSLFLIAKKNADAPLVGKITPGTRSLDGEIMKDVIAAFAWMTDMDWNVTGRIYVDERLLAWSLHSQKARNGYGSMCGGVCNLSDSISAPFSLMTRTEELEMDEMLASTLYVFTTLKDHNPHPHIISLSDPLVDARRQQQPTPEKPSLPTPVSPSQYEIQSNGYKIFLFETLLGEAAVAKDIL